MIHRTYKKLAISRQLHYNLQGSAYKSFVSCLTVYGHMIDIHKLIENLKPGLLMCR